MKYIKEYNEYGRGPQGTNKFQMGHKDYDADMENAKKDLAQIDKRRNDPTQFSSYDPKTGRDWTPETLAVYIKDRYGV